VRTLQIFGRTARWCSAAVLLAAAAPAAGGHAGGLTGPDSGETPLGWQADATVSAGVTPAGGTTAAALDGASGARLRVYLMTMGPGDAVWEKFGHNAIWIHDPERGVDPAFNYGIFSFDQPGFIGRLLRGNMLYTMAPYDAAQTVQHYGYFDRPVWAQELNLTAAQKLALYEFLEWNALPENADYQYDYFRDNCSTRVRDAIDRVLGGALRTALDTVATGSTYRSESLRLTSGSVPVSTGLLLALGPDVDRPLSAWEESFVPMRLSEHLARVRVPASVGLVGGNGVDAPLVAAEMQLFQADRAPPPERAPGRTAWYLAAGLLLAGAFGAGRVRAGARAAAPSRAWLAAAAAWSIIVGVFGTLIALLWVVTDHTDTYRNLNLLFAHPLALVLGVILAAAAVSGAAPASATRALALATGVLAAAGVVLSLLPFTQQVNGPIVALLAPPQLVVAVLLYTARSRNPSPSMDTPAPAAARAAGR
jgi:hypothetical protein